MTKRYVETPEAIPAGYRLRVVHLHNGNTSNSKRNGHPMVTIAQLVHEATGEVHYEAKSRCSKDETMPSRRVGRHVAVGRVLRQYDDQFADAVLSLSL